MDPSSSSRKIDHVSTTFLCYLFAIISSSNTRQARSQSAPSRAAFAQFNKLTHGNKWGVLYSDSLPVSQKELEKARNEMMEEVIEPFVTVREKVPRISTSRAAIARDTAFREIILSQYQRRCAVSGISLATQTVAEVQAAHVVGLSRGGADEPRNGFTLTSTLHWAFDKGLFGVSDTRRVIVSQCVREMPQNVWLFQFHDKPILEAAKSTLRTAREAFAWHRENILDH